MQYNTVQHYMYHRTLPKRMHSPVRLGHEWAVFPAAHSSWQGPEWNLLYHFPDQYQQCHLLSPPAIHVLAVSTHDKT